MKRLTTSALVVVISTALVQTVFAQRKLAPLPVEDALAQKSFPLYMPIDLSSDGQWLAYTLENSLKQETRLEAKQHYYSPSGVTRACSACEVWLANTKTGEAISLAPTKGHSSWGPVWSPDGSHLAFYSDEQGTANLWVWERATRKTRRVSDAIVRPYMTLQVLRWTPDNKKILTRILPYGTTVADGEKAMAAVLNQAESAESKKATVTLFDSAAQDKKAESLDYIAAFDADLAVIDIATGEVKTLATGFRVFDYRISPDNQNVAFTHFRGFESSNSTQSMYDLLLVPLSGAAKPRVIAASIAQEFGVDISWSPDGSVLSYMTSGSRAKGECMLVPVSGGAPRKATEVSHPYFADSFRPPLWDATGRYLYTLTKEGAVWKTSVADAQASEVARITDRTVLDLVWLSGPNTLWFPEGERSLVVATRAAQTKEVGFYKVDLTTGKVSKLREESKSYALPVNYSMDTSADGQTVAYISESAADAPDIWISDATFSNPRQITRTSGEIDKYEFGTSSLVEWRSADGLTLRGTLLLPAGYKQGQRYPLIVYGYPLDKRSEKVNRFGITGTGVENMQLFATRGYAVFFPDIVIREGTTMRDMAKSILPGIDKVVEMGVADPDRVGVMGHSFGGYMVLSLIVQSTRFKAAIMRGGYGNQIGMYGSMERNGSSRAQMLYEKDAGFRGLGGTPWEVRDRYIENSPVFYLDKVETPLLIVHGGSETTVPLHLANEIFVDLRRLGKKVVFARYDGENHGESNWGYLNQVDYCERIIAWFDRWLKAPDSASKGSTSVKSQ